MLAYAISKEMYVCYYVLTYDTYIHTYKAANMKIAIVRQKCFYHNFLITMFNYFFKVVWVAGGGYDKWQYTVENHLHNSKIY